MATIGQKLREWAGMSTKEDIKKTGQGDTSNTGLRGKQVNRNLCQQGYEEYCPERQTTEIKDAVDKANSRGRAGSK